MIKKMILIILKILGGLALIVLLAIGFFMFKSKVAIGYRVKFNSVQYYFKKNGADQVLLNSRKVVGADAKSFEIVAEVPAYGKDKNRVYYKGNELPEVDPNSFSAKGLFNIRTLCRDQQNVYFGNRLVSRDADDFQQLGPNYFKDSDVVYLKEVPIDRQYLNQSHFLKIEGPDAKSFESVEGFQFLGKDNRHVYFKADRVEGAVANAIRKLNGFWTDEQNIFHHGDQLKNVDLQSFEVMQYPFAKDKNKIFYEHLALPQSDPETFGFIPTASSSYSKDQHQVYFKHKVIPKANPKTFEQVLKGFSHWKDGQHVYYNGELLVDANPKTFEILMGSHGRRSHYFGSDGQSIYFMAKKLEGANAATFSPDQKDRHGYDQWSDGKHRFDSKGKRIKN